MAPSGGSQWGCCAVVAAAATGTATMVAAGSVAAFAGDTFTVLPQQQLRQSPAGLGQRLRGDTRRGFAPQHSTGARPGQPWASSAGALALGTLAASAAAAAVSAAVGTGRRTARRGRGRQPTCVSAVNPNAPIVLEVKGVHAMSTDEDRKQILKGLDLTIREGEVHAIMGPNGSGKSTLSRVLAGDRGYEVTEGSAMLGDKALFDLEPHERALAGLFLAFQSPPAIAGVSNLDFLRAIYNAQRRSREEPELDVIEFYGLVTEKLTQLKVNPDFLNRNVNEGFSGGERKRNEMLQMSVLEPKLAILDEIDSGLDIDALKDVADAIDRVRSLDDGKRSLLVVTHFERFLQYINADYVHVMHRGRIIKSGGRELANRLDAEGYDWVLKECGL
mmetsp:Transcript_84761/g.243285  ORF Transcript_84761/g.243285 Transcript_84761/m.243285 type:complete len:389 (+) Transcript_84761:45-1211(+)